MKQVFDTKFNNAWHFGSTFSEVNLESSITDVILLTKPIFLASKFEVLTLNIFNQSS